MFDVSADFLEGRHFQRARPTFFCQLLEKDPRTGDLSLGGVISSEDESISNPSMVWEGLHCHSSFRLVTLSAFFPSMPAVMDSHISALSCFRISFRMSSNRPSPTYSYDKNGMGKNQSGRTMPNWARRRDIASPKIAKFAGDPFQPNGIIK